RIAENQLLDNGGGKLPACGVFLQQCVHVDIEDNAILDNGTIEDVGERVCIDFRTMPVGSPPVIPPETGVKFAFLDRDGHPTGPGMIEEYNAFIGLKGTESLEIDLPASASVEVTLLPFDAALELVALAGKTQVDSARVHYSQTEQRIWL